MSLENYSVSQGGLREGREGGREGSGRVERGKEEGAIQFDIVDYTHTHAHTNTRTGHIPIDVCFVQRVRTQLPSRSFFTRKKVAQGLPLKSEDRDKIFLLARNPDEFYKTIINLQVL